MRTPVRDVGSRAAGGCSYPSKLPGPMRCETYLFREASFLTILLHLLFPTVWHSQLFLESPLPYLTSETAQTLCHPALPQDHELGAAEVPTLRRLCQVPQAGSFSSSEDLPGSSHPRVNPFLSLFFPVPLWGSPTPEPTALPSGQA